MHGEIDEATWQHRQRTHEARVDRWLAPHLERRSRQIAHPVDDFLFTYYSYRPAALRRWHPGIGSTLLGDVGGFARLTGYRVNGGRAVLDPGLMASRAARVHGVRSILVATAGRQPMLGCFGLHEWAMVYRQPPDARRHARYQLRLGSPGTDHVVDTHRITCTHYDAFRFFTPAARPLNVLQPRRDDQAANDQPGCLHAAMDCYKWAYKLAPFAPAELVADCFALARAVRRVDMRASPYDLADLDLEPIAIETAEGKAVYLAAQADFAARAAPLRDRLVSVCDTVLTSAEPESA